MYTYLSLTAGDLVIFAHSLIAVNRLWAVIFPFSYRTQHTAKVAIILCGFALLLVNASSIPTAIFVAAIKPVFPGSTVLHCEMELANVGVWNYMMRTLLFDRLAAFVCCYRLPNRLL